MYSQSLNFLLNMAKAKLKKVSFSRISQVTFTGLQRNVQTLANSNLDEREKQP